MWVIYEHGGLWRSLKKLPNEVKKRYEKWKDIVRISGPKGLKEIKGFRDEALKGEWKGCRSSRLGNKYRVIYKQEKRHFIVKVVRVSGHDYRRKQ